MLHILQGLNNGNHNKIVPRPIMYVLSVEVLIFLAHVTLNWSIFYVGKQGTRVESVQNQLIVHNKVGVIIVKEP